MKPKPPTVSIRSNSHGNASIRINGRDIPNLLSVELIVHAGQVNLVAFVMLAPRLEVDAVAEVTPAEIVPPEKPTECEHGFGVGARCPVCADYVETPPEHAP